MKCTTEKYEADQNAYQIIEITFSNGGMHCQIHIINAKLNLHFDVLCLWMPWMLLFGVEKRHFTVIDVSG